MARAEPIHGKSGILIPGFHAVQEILDHASHRIEEIWISERKKSPRVREILRMAREKNIPVFFKKNDELSRHLPEMSHQGIAARTSPFTYVDLEHLQKACSHNSALILALDHITDEGNLGAIIRTAAFFSVDGMILPKDRSAGMSPAVLKRSSGAFIHLPVARVVNLGNALSVLKSRGLWIIGTCVERGTSIYTFDWDRPVVLVLGNEHKGISPSIRKLCDQLVAIPVSGHGESLNVAVAGGVILSEIVRQRKRRLA